MKQLLGVLLALSMLVGATPAMAAIDFDANGRLVQSGTYTGPGFSTTDVEILATLLVGGVLLYQVNSPVVKGVVPAALIAWGANRTAKFRPESVKQRIRTALENRTVVPGSIDGMR